MVFLILKNRISIMTRITILTVCRSLSTKERRI